MEQREIVYCAVAGLSSQLHLQESEKMHAATAECHKVSNVTIKLFSFIWSAGERIRCGAGGESLEDGVRDGGVVSMAITGVQCPQLLHTASFHQYFWTLSNLVSAL